ncbi:MAG: type II secretion system protein [Armatimonadota bacterium]
MGLADDAVTAAPEARREKTMSSTRITKKPARPRSRAHPWGFTLIELILVMAVIVTLASLALPSAIGSRKLANEASAVQTLRTIASAQSLFRDRNIGGDNAFATLAELETPPGGTPSLVRWPTAGSYVRSGYVFTDVEPPTRNTWCVVASPIVPGTTGDRYFGIAEDSLVRESFEELTSREQVLESDETKP